MRVVDAQLSVCSTEMLELLSSPTPACVPCISSIVSGVHPGEVCPLVLVRIA